MINYAKLEFKSGLEIHQRLDTRKLFCHCPSILRDGKPDFITRRKLRAVAGESGTIDPAARFEMEKDLEFIYEGYLDSTCLVELDEEPVQEINNDALEIAFQISLMLNCKILDEIFVMRKIVVDGSAISGFQRTMLVSRNGIIQTAGGPVRIYSVCLEEESAKNIDERGSTRTWRLDRLGIPLVEIQTYPDLKDADHVRETAEKLGMILRSTNKIQRGIGTIRQDINLSILNGPRVEIKGFQDIRNMQKTIDKEILRQLDLIKQGKKLSPEVRKVNEDSTTSFLRPLPGAARMYPETDHSIIQVDRSSIRNIRLPELLTGKINRFSLKYKISADISRIIVKEREVLFENLTAKFKNIDSSIIATTLALTLKDLKTRLKLTIESLTFDDFYEIFSYLDHGKITKDAIPDMLADKLRGIKIDVTKYSIVDDKELEINIENLIKKNKGASPNAIMGQIMKQYRGRVSGQKVINIIKKYQK